MLIARLCAALVPWHHWGRVMFVESLDGTREVEGVRFFTLEWLGLHLHIQFGPSVPIDVREMRNGI
ncbi:hypothetical protein [Sphingomonas sanxanigenens]|uniref:Uncharacterized protein n=1 Tax=Sphingomonas sanxanigenens DSM 19645 = NX02 TaxID=1123269 RepID=W0AM40_9SPHN|nr:hypothetical protein [Sphingomonas sanxanigenens]AHE57408.1 hypothetical protein NX02_29200 [Sphingomonas sanxanigenens DSM 19645 = NX02]